MKDPLSQKESVLAEVTAVDGFVIEVSPIDGRAPILDVRLQASDSNGILAVPSIGSVVMVQMISNVSGVVVMFSHIESIKFMDGSFGGLIKVEDLVSKLNNLENDVNNLKQLITSWVVVPNDGGAALKSVLASWSGQSISITNSGDLENENITHGKP